MSHLIKTLFVFLLLVCMRGFKSVPHSDLLELVLHDSVLFMTKEMNILVIISFFYIYIKKKHSWASMCQLYILTLQTGLA